jgi:oligopeptide transport system permease protein
MTAPVPDEPAIFTTRSQQRSALAVFRSSIAGLTGLVVLGIMLLACVGSLPYTLGKAAPGEDGAGSPRFDAQDRLARQLPPTWWPAPRDPVESWLPADHETAERIRAVAARRTAARLGDSTGRRPTPEEVRAARPFYWMGTDLLGRSLLIRCLTGGGISLAIGIAAAMLSVVLGTFYGAVSGYVGGRLDAVMMRIVDILYGLPYILLVVLLAVAVDAKLDDMQAARAARVTAQKNGYVQAALAALPPDQEADAAVRRRLQREATARYGTGELSIATVQTINLVTLFVAIGGVSWLTMARVVRGQVLSLKAQPFMEAARAMGVPLSRQFLRHLLPNLVGPIIVYATLTVPQAILQESFLSFLGIGVKPPLPSWGNLAADGLQELNRYKSNWWLVVFPCVLLACTLLSLNFVGEGLRESLDPRRARR